MAHNKLKMQYTRRMYQLQFFLALLYLPFRHFVLPVEFAERQFDSWGA